MAGPLEGTRIIDLGGIGPGPFAGMLLADLGAEVIRIARPGAAEQLPVLQRGKTTLEIDLKTARGRDVVLDLVTTSDACFEGFRPGVAERIGIGPKDVAARNPRIIYGRVTGWGQEGPLAASAGHDLNYIALTGVLGMTGRRGGVPAIPQNLLGDYAGGSMLLVIGLLAALLETRSSGQGQVVDAAMVDGAALLATLQYGMHAAGQLGPRGTNILDSGAPFYDAYETADGGYIALAAIEPQFYAEMVRVLGLEPDRFGRQMDTSRWQELKPIVAAAVRKRTRAAWEAAFAGVDACFAPVLGFDEAPRHPHARARGAFLDRDGIIQPAPAPRFSRTPTAVQPTQPPERQVSALLAPLGYAEQDLDDLRSSGVLR